MLSPRFFVSLPLSVNTLFSLPDDAAHHAARVLRLKQGDEIVLFNGEGGEYLAVISDMNRRNVQVKIEAHRDIDRESPLSIILVQAITSGERMDYAVQKAVELGVSRIVPIIADRSSIRLKADRAAKRVEHWQKVAVSACEQCGRNRVPEVTAISTLAAVLAGSEDHVNWILHPQNSQPLGEQPRPDTTVNLVIGPEGGFTDKELQLAQRHGCVCISMGPRVLRMETAGPAALAIMQSRWGDG